jgi:tetratricopeptide (TPR) repeat protein
MKRLVLLVALAAGCAAPPPAPPPGPPADKPTQPDAPVVTPAPKENIAVAGLMETARADAASGNIAGAAASLERALRIEPRNARLWHELARVRLKQGEYAQAESVAARSNSWAGEDRALRAENWRLIAESRRARGDTEGAQKALELSKR